MADVKIQVVRGTLPTGSVGTTKDFTISGFGTPKAAIVIASLNTNDDTIDSHARTSFGVYDGTNQFCVASRSLTGQGTSLVVRRHSASNVFVNSNNDGTIYFGVNAHSFVTDGVKLRVNTGNAAAYYVTVILIGGTDVSDVLVGNVDLGTGTSAIDVNSLGFEPSLVIASTAGLSGTDTSSSYSTAFSLGIGVNDGSDTQRVIGSSERGSLTTSQADGIVRNNAIASKTFDDGETWSAAISDYDANGFSITPSTSASNAVLFYAALKFTNSPAIDLFDVTIPTSGDYTKTGLGFTPEFGFMGFLGGATAANSIYSGSTGLSFSAFDANTIASNSTTTKDGVGTTVAKAFSADAFKLINGDGTTVDAVASAYSLDSGGWDFTLSTNPSSAILGWGLAIGIAAGTDYTDSIPVSGIGSTSVSDSYTVNHEDTVSVSAIGSTSVTDTPGVDHVDSISVSSVGAITATDSFTVNHEDIIAVSAIGSATVSESYTVNHQDIVSVSAVGAISISFLEIVPEDLVIEGIDYRVESSENSYRSTSNGIDYRTT